MKRAALILLALTTVVKIQAQEEKPYTQPKLVVGIVVDQMRFDYLTRFWDRFGDGGFKRLVNEGFEAKNHHFNYVPTATGPGHTSVYTGTTPAVHGILGNNWYDKFLKESVYCTADENYPDLGTENTGGMAPTRLLTTTITDQLRLHYQFRSKVVGVAIKDRGAILPVGHTANAAYWFEGRSTGNWISSKYYFESLPNWVKKYNKKHSVDQYRKTWETLEPLKSYVESGSDVNNYEGLSNGETASGFPHQIDKLWDQNGQYSSLAATPFGNSLTTDFAFEVIEQEQMGADEIPDFLAISYSSPDYIGHKYGVNSVEVQDNYMRLDLELERLLDYLDDQVGEGEYTLFLTADHGAIHVPAFLNDQKIPAGYLDTKAMAERLYHEVEEQFGDRSLIESISYNEIYLNKEILKALEKEGFTSASVRTAIANILYDFDHVERVYTSDQLRNFGTTSGFNRIIYNGYHPKRSGDIVFVQSPGYVSYSRTGSTHGSAMIYDTHVPLLFFGKGIPAGSTAERTEIPDIAPTLAVLLGIGMPNGTTGTPIEDLLED
ncbi:MAG: alkaline phosphatase PafA [Flavobacteriaceae bacterium]